jgi:hypothetical protein
LVDEVEIPEPGQISRLGDGNLHLAVVRKTNRDETLSKPSDSQNVIAA